MAETPKAGTALGDGEGFDVVIERLRSVVEKLEGGSLSLEHSLAAFEEGVRLSRRGAQILDQAERRVEMLTRGEAGDAVVPFPSDADDGGGRRSDGDGGHGAA